MKKQKDQINGFLGKDTEFDGKLSFTGSVRIDGRYSGEIIAEGVLVVGESAFIEADIKASHLIVSGEIRGNITAGKKIEIHADGKVFGNIESPAINIQEGAIFEGVCRMKGGKELAASEKSGKKVAVLHNENS